jgi:predicted nuclease of restriction endonuclease-like (RecB) superfamily
MDTLRKEYRDWFSELKSKVRSAQAKAAITINAALISFYWELGKMISETQTAYGTGFLEQVSKDLKSEFPEMKGLSYRNLALCRQFYQFYLTPSNLQQAVADFKNSSTFASSYDEIMVHPASQIPWGHNVLIFSKSENIDQAHFYLHQTIYNAWSRDILALQIKSKLHSRQGNAVTNFKKTLPDPYSD